MVVTVVVAVVVAVVVNVAVIVFVVIVVVIIGVSQPARDVLSTLVHLLLPPVTDRAINDNRRFAETLFLFAGTGGHDGNDSSVD